MYKPAFSLFWWKQFAYHIQYYKVLHMQETLLEAFY